MARLIAFGCSFTYGHGLSDCFIPPQNPGPYPSKFAWPSLVADSLELEVINNSECGSSNKQILYRTLDFAFVETDTVIFLWSFFQRSIIHNVDSNLQILPNNSECEGYYKVHSDYDLFMETTLSIAHANLFLLDKKIKIYNFYLDRDLRLLLSQYPNNVARNYELSYIPRSFQDIGLDKVHPGEKTQKTTANSIIKFIKEKEHEFTQVLG
ncbi:MAG: hypothetical protein ACOVLB_00100 [Candidatus Nanopelagicus sp.]